MPIRALNLLIPAFVGLFLFTPSFSMDQLSAKDTTMNGVLKPHSNLNYMETLDTSLLKEITDVLALNFAQDVKIESIAQLSEPERRNFILRIILQPRHGVPHSLIFKQTLAENDKEDEKEALGRFARDYAGLEFLSSLPTKTDSTTPTTPRFYSGSPKYRFVLLEDLGENHTSLVDSLTGDNPELAKAALRRFVACLGKFHGDSYGKTDEYNRILIGLNPDAESEKDNANEFLVDMAAALAPLNIPLSEELSSEIRQVIHTNLEPGPFTTYIHGDICPDNVFDNPEKNELRLIDFEWGKVRNALLDGTYLRMGWPTCWCSKALPDDLIAPLEAMYREQLTKNVPAARDDLAYEYAYTSACAFWMLHIIPRINEVMEKDKCWNSGPTPENSKWDPQKNLARPRIFTRLQAFINVSKEQMAFQHLRFMAEKILAELQVRWPAAGPMDVYPAFK